jgi:hypothetical protein
MGVTIYDQRAEQNARDALQTYSPGSYLFKNLKAEHVAERYFKVDRDTWLSMLTHDYTIACLRRDDEAKTKLKEAYSKLAEMLDWKDRDPWRKVEEDIKASAEKTAKCLFELYKEVFRAEGWRGRPDETVKEGIESRLLDEPSPTGDLYRSEYGRWVALKHASRGFSADVRLKDRVAFWMGGRLEAEALWYVYGRGAYEHITYLDEVLDDIILGKKTDYWNDTSMWWVSVAVRSLEDHLVAGIIGRTEAEDPMAMACMALERIDPDPARVEEYLADLTERLKLRTIRKALDLPKLYHRAKYGPMGRENVIEGSLFKEWVEMDEREKRCRKAQMITGLVFVGNMASLMQFLREKYGYQRSEQLDRVARRASECTERVARGLR